MKFNQMSKKITSLQNFQKLCSTNFIWSILEYIIFNNNNVYVSDFDFLWRLGYAYWKTNIIKFNMIPLGLNVLVAKGTVTVTMQIF